MNNEPDSVSAFGKAIGQLLREKNMTQGELARRSGLQESYISKLVNGIIGEPRQKIRCQLAQGFGMTEAELLERVQQELAKEPIIEPQPPRPPVPKQFEALIAEKTEGFVGREFVFEAIAAFLKRQPNGYFTIAGDPGAGKSALLAKFVQQTGCVAHFNVRSQGINRADQFLDSVCRQLRDRYKPNSSALPADATRDGKFLAQLLAEIAPALEGVPPEKKPLVIAIDALDEVEHKDDSTNLLYLPQSPPKGVYFVLTKRAVTLPLRVEAPQEEFDLMAERDKNLQDVKKYIRTATERPQVWAWIEERRLSVEEFVEQVAEKSENNFMYLRYVLGDIEGGKYGDLSVERLPNGLQNYYEEHWRRMGMTAKPLPRRKLKIIYLLSKTRLPVTCDLLADFAEEDAFDVQEVLDDWEQFLRRSSDVPPEYSIYHSSFQNFLHRKDIVQKAGVSLRDIESAIASNLLKDLYGDE